MKPSLVLLSGLLSNKLLWQHQADHLKDIADIHCIPSFQDTPKKMVQAILQTAPPIFALAGHSMGGWLCLEIVRTAPSRVLKLCLLNTTARMDSEEKRNQRLDMIQKAEQGYFQEMVKSMPQQFIHNQSIKTDVENMFLDVGQKAFIDQEKAMLQRKECFSILPTISCPTLVIHAQQDKIFSLAEHEELAAKIPNAKLAIVKDSGHMSPMEAPQAITDLLRFWLNDFYKIDEKVPGC